MAQDLLTSCGLSLQNVKYLYLASRQTTGEVISFPIEYTTKTGTTDSVILITAWDAISQTVTIGGQVLQWIEVLSKNQNIDFQEEYRLTKQGKTYVKTITINELPQVNYYTNSRLKEFLFTADGEFAIGKAVAFIIDENGSQWICGYDIPLILQTGMELGVSEQNYYSLSLQSISYSRIRNYELIQV